jgi:hypothetical protein
MDDNLVAHGRVCLVGVRTSLVVQVAQVAWIMYMGVAFFLHKCMKLLKLL